MLTDPDIVSGFFSPRPVGHFSRTEPTKTICCVGLSRFSESIIVMRHGPLSRIMRPGQRKKDSSQENARRTLAWANRSVLSVVPRPRGLDSDSADGRAGHDG